MSDETSKVDTSAHSWDTYWHGAHESAAYTQGGSSHPLVLAFWQDYFRGIRDLFESPKIIDIASGNGAVIDSAVAAYAGRAPEFTCVDISASAIAMLEERFDGVQGVVADANSIPLPAAHFDIATSQFGLEYAGRAALDEAARLIAPGGQLAMLMHYRDGGIHRHCATSLAAIRQLQASNFLALCTAMFDAGFDALGGAQRSAFDAAAKDLVPALRAVESIMLEHGRTVADNTIVRLYRDVRTMHDNMARYARADVLDWLQRMRGEIDAYAARMDSMCNAAIDASRFAELCARLRGHGFTLLRDEPAVTADTATPLAWALIAQKQR